VNCEFVTIPTDPRGWDAPAGVREGTATVFTRDSLLGSLADSGFQLRQHDNLPTYGIGIG
jgi:hypothetical protein